MSDRELAVQIYNGWCSVMPWMCLGFSQLDDETQQAWIAAAIVARDAVHKADEAANA